MLQLNNANMVNGMLDLEGAGGGSFEFIKIPAARHRAGDATEQRMDRTPVFYIGIFWGAYTEGLGLRLGEAPLA